MKYEVIEAIAGRDPLAVWNGDLLYDAWRTLGALVADDLDNNWFMLVVVVTNPEPGIVCRMTLETEPDLSRRVTKQWSIRSRE